MRYWHFADFACHFTAIFLSFGKGNQSLSARL
jgi:hypothetical protein